MSDPYDAINTLFVDDQGEELWQASLLELPRIGERIRYALPERTAELCKGNVEAEALAREIGLVKRRWKVLDVERSYTRRMVWRQGDHRLGGVFHGHSQSALVTLFELEGALLASEKTL